MSRRRPQRRRRWPWLILLLAQRGAAGGALWWEAPSSNSTVGGLALGPRTGPAPSFAVPAEYHIVYRVTAGSSVSTEAVWVKRPFDSYVEDLEGPPPGGAVSVVTLHRLGDQIISGASGARPALIHVAAAAAAGDIRLDAVAGPLLRSGVILPVHQQVVRGRRCRVFRSAESLRTSGPLPSLKAGSTYVDTCIDSDGLMLAEERYEHGVLVSRLVATTVETGEGAAAGGDFALSAPPTPFYQGGGSFTPLTLSSAPPSPSWSASYVPSGYQHAGRFAVVPSQPQVFATPDNGPPSSSGLPNALVTELDDTFVDGPNVIVLQQGTTIGGSRFNPPPGGQKVELGNGLGSGQLVLTALGPILTAEPGGTQFVRVIGTVAPDVLIRVARSLSQQPPGTLTTIPGSAPLS